MDAARVLFAERGFAGTSVRAVAAAAAVDPALVHHYFGTKEGLFRSVVEMPIDPEELFARVVADGAAEAPRRLVEAVVGVWDSPETGPAMVSFMRRVVADQGSIELMRDYFGATVLRTAATSLLGDVDQPEAESRVALVASQVLGVMLLRKVMALEPLASMPAHDLVAALTPTIARYLHGDLPSQPDAAPSRSPAQGEPS